MSTALASEPAVRRLAVVCFGLSASRRTRQPWHSAAGLAQGLAGLGHEVLLVTDVHDPPQGPYQTSTLDRLFSFGGPSRDLASALAAFGAEQTFIFLGASRLVRLGTLSTRGTVSLVLAGQRWRLGELLRLSWRTMWSERAMLALPLCDALLPGSFLSRAFRRSGADDIVYLSEAARSRYATLGLPAGRQLRPQVSPPLPVEPLYRRDRPTIAYIGSALALRGADLVLDAFEQAVAAGLRARLLVFLRSDGPPTGTRRLVDRCTSSMHRQWITCETRHLSPQELWRQLGGVDAFVLPFRVTVSDVPLVVIEAGLTGKPVVVLDTPGVSEVARAFNGIVVADPCDLPAALADACRRPRRPPEDPSAWTSWEHAAAALLQPPAPRVDHLALLALCGGDGAGKTTLADALAARLHLGRRRPKRIWSRFRSYLSRPLLAVARLTGHNRKEVIAGVRIGYHEFARCRPLAAIYLVLQLSDMWLDLRLRFRARHDRVLVADRSILDSLVDLAVDTGMEDLVIDRLAPWLSARLPRPWAAVVVERPVGRIAAQRPDALVDRHFGRRRALYRRLAERLQLPMVQNDRTIEAALADILATAGGTARDRESAP